MQCTKDGFCIRILSPLLKNFYRGKMRIWVKLSKISGAVVWNTQKDAGKSSLLELVKGKSDFGMESVASVQFVHRQSYSFHC